MVSLTSINIVCSSSKLSQKANDYKKKGGGGAGVSGVRDPRAPLNPPLHCTLSFASVIS